MSKFLKRGVAALLCLCLMLSVMPRVQAAQGSGSFYFCVMTANRVIVEPEAISYTAGRPWRRRSPLPGTSWNGLRTAASSPSTASAQVPALL